MLTAFNKNNLIIDIQKKKETYLGVERNKQSEPIKKKIKKKSRY